MELEIKLFIVSIVVVTSILISVIYFFGIPEFQKNVNKYNERVDTANKYCIEKQFFESNLDFCLTYQNQERIK
jgi:hypothetical protein